MDCVVTNGIDVRKRRMMIICRLTYLENLLVGDCEDALAFLGQLAHFL